MGNSKDGGIEVIKSVNNAWDQERKAELVKIGQSQKPYSEILMYLDNEIQTSKRMTTFDHKVVCFRSDGIYQLHRAIEDVIGVTSVQREGTMSKEFAMETIDIILADGTRKKVPYGKIELPDMGKDAHIEILYSDKDKYMRVSGECQFRYQPLIDRIIQKTMILLNTDSIYKNQAIEINAKVDKGQPNILDLSKMSTEQMILSDEVEYALAPLKARILHAEKCISKNIPLKYGALLEGPYGTGKTLLAFKIAEEATANNWSFVYLKSPELLADTIRMCKTLDKNGNGIIVFCEDVDQVTRGERNAALQDILNTLDGGDTKHMNVISLFTTNHLELIEPTFLRGKRIGSIISMPYLNAVTAQKYLDLFCADNEFDGDFVPVLKLIEDSNIAPAFMAEIVENVKTNMVLREENVVTATNLLVCVKSYLRQVNLSQTKDTSITKEMALATSLKAVIHDDEYFEKIASLE